MTEAISFHRTQRQTNKQTNELTRNTAISLKLPKIQFYENQGIIKEPVIKKTYCKLSFIALAAILDLNKERKQTFLIHSFQNSYFTLYSEF